MGAGTALRFVPMIGKFDFVAEILTPPLLSSLFFFGHPLINPDYSLVERFYPLDVLGDL